MEEITLQPQPGPQVAFACTPADIAVYGGAAGGGKTWSLLFEPLRHIENPRFSTVTFRRTFPQITNEGGLWDESALMYPMVSAEPKVSVLEWEFPSGATARFAHMQHEDDVHQWQGAQVPLINFDELTHFTERQFFYMLSRNRSMCGVKPYVRATTNPDANSWVKTFCGPWVDRGFKGKRAKSGEIRYFVRREGQIVWVPQGTPRSKSVTFIFASVYDNKKLLEANPEYLDNLMALPLVDQERLLHGNWDIVESGNMFKAEWLVPCLFPDVRFRRLIRYWDLAGTKKEDTRKKHDPDYTAGLLLGKGYDGIYYILDCILARDTPGRISELIKRTAQNDCDNWGRTEICIEQEPGSSGQYLVDHFVTDVLKGFSCSGYRSTGDKVSRAKAASKDCQFGKVKMCRGEWNDLFLAMATAFPTEGVHDDPVDALSGAHAKMNMLPDRQIYTPSIKLVRSGWTQ